MIDFDAIVQAIKDGELDDKLTTISDVCHQRKRYLRDSQNLENKAAVNVNDIYTLQDLSPKYMEGLRVKVLKKEKTRAEVEVIDEDKPSAGKFRSGPFLAKYNMLKPKES